YRFHLHRSGEAQGNETVERRISCAVRGDGGDNLGACAFTGYGSAGCMKWSPVLRDGVKPLAALEVAAGSVLSAPQQHGSSWQEDCSVIVAGSRQGVRATFHRLGLGIPEF